MLAKLGPLFRSVPLARAATLAALGALGLWVYWPTLAAMSHKWGHDPQYSHGYLVPAFAAVLLWMRRSRLPAAPATLSWWGVALVLGAAVLRLAGAYTYFDWLEAVSLLPCLAGLCVLLGGWPG